LEGLWRQVQGSSFGFHWGLAGGCFVALLQFLSCIICFSDCQGVILWPGLTTCCFAQLFLHLDARSFQGFQPAGFFGLPAGFLLSLAQTFGCRFVLLAFMPASDHQASGFSGELANRGEALPWITGQGAPYGWNCLPRYCPR
jgi:hypothetical protein